MREDSIAPWAIVPVKPLARAKGRLASLLDAHEREALARAMLRDVLGALLGTRALAGVLVVTGDREVVTIAQQAGAVVLADIANAGQAAASNQAAAHLAARRCQAMLAVPSDLPSLTCDDVDALVHGHAGARAITIAPDVAVSGTNALCCSPPDVIATQFGEDSFRRHCEAARRAGIEPRIANAGRIARDVDRPDDLLAFASSPSVTHAYRYLASSGILRRLESSRNVGANAAQRAMVP